MKNLPNFIFEVHQGETPRRVEFSRPSLKHLKLSSLHVVQNDMLAAAMAIAENTAVSGIEGLQDQDPAAFTAVCNELYRACMEQFPDVEVEDKGTHWLAKIDGQEQRIEKPSMEVIKLTSRAQGTNLLHAGECLLVGGLPADSPYWQDGIHLAALALAMAKAFDKSLPKVRRITLGEHLS